MNLHVNQLVQMSQVIEGCGENAILHVIISPNL